MCGKSVLLGDSDENPCVLHLLDDAADLPVVEPDRLTGMDVIEHLWNRAADHGGGEDHTSAVIGRRPARLEVSGENQQVALPQREGIFTRRNAANLLIRRGPASTGNDRFTISGQWRIAKQDRMPGLRVAVRLDWGQLCDVAIE